MMFCMSELKLHAMLTVELDAWTMQWSIPAVLLLWVCVVSLPSNGVANIVTLTAPLAAARTGINSVSEGLDLIRSGSEHLTTKTDAALLDCITEILADMQELDNPGGWSGLMLCCMCMKPGKGEVHRVG
jgi:hypothetical protein